VLFVFGLLSFIAPSRPAASLLATGTFQPPVVNRSGRAEKTAGQGYICFKEPVGFPAAAARKKAIHLTVSLYTSYGHLIV